ncbi:hypothetical protein [Streptomyces sp. IB2014 016-6]|uniref:hypothetical protein n=1 Tax=Streptomyces sp. IB2014 016-6 TaxID=2517818 RepID=UPI001650556A|nr:hypothetical protein [Streptomyces sp. IB2014 016-6]
MTQRISLNLSVFPSVFRLLSAFLMLAAVTALIAGIAVRTVIAVAHRNLLPRPMKAA